MTKLPEKTLLDGSKLPKTTTGEMKDALGKLRDYLNDLLGEDSADREAARLALGIDLTGLGAQIGSKSDRTELETRAQVLEAEIAKRGIPVGSIDWFAAATPPAGYLKADGAAVGRQTYPDLFAAIGTTYGEGDGETTFNLPDLIGRFAEGSETPGTVKEAGLPDLTGDITNIASGGSTTSITTGGFAITQRAFNSVQTGGINNGHTFQTNFSASRSNPIYGASDTVQPPALTVCYGIRVKNRLHAAIKAFDAAVDQGLVDITELANDIQKAKTPVGTVAWFAMSSPPVGYLVANGAAVGRATYPDLFAAIGTMYGEGDRETTFNLPNLIGRFAEGSETPGTVKEAGLPDLTGDITNIASGGSTTSITTGGFAITQRAFNSVQTGGINNGHTFQTNFSASRSNPIYGASDTVQPPALTLLPCIKAFDATVNTGLINVTELAQDVAGKAERSQAANLAMPSGTFVELTLPPSGSNIVAPADGYIYLDKTSTAQGQYIAVFSGGMGLSEIALQSGQILRATLPVKRGTNILPDYNAAGTTNHFRFIYAEGSQP